MIALKVNGKDVQLDGPTPLLVYLEKLGVSPRAVAVEHNAVIIERDAYATTTLADGDTVEIVKMVGGGRSGHGRPIAGKGLLRREGANTGGEASAEHSDG